jgi:hypothetical protein
LVISDVRREMREIISDLNSSRKDARGEACGTVESWFSEFEVLFLLEVVWAYDGFSLLLIWLDTTWCDECIEKLSVETKFGLEF